MILNFDEYGEDDDDDDHYHDDIDEGKDVVHKREYVVKKRTLIGFIKKILDHFQRMMMMIKMIMVRMVMKNNRASMGPPYEA